MAVMRVCAATPLVVGFNFIAAFFALKHWHGNSQKYILTNHNNFTCRVLDIKTSASIAFYGAETYKQQILKLLLIIFPAASAAFKPIFSMTSI